MALLYSSIQDSFENSTLDKSGVSFGLIFGQIFVMLYWIFCGVVEGEGWFNEVLGYGRLVGSGLSGFGEGILLYTITLVVNFVCLVAAVWLGIYVVTRSLRSPVAWLTGLTLWSIASFFLNFFLALNPPTVPPDLPNWVQLLLPFWPTGTLESGWSGWLQGWLVVPAIAFWHHATMLMRPGPMNHWRWTRVLFVYVTALAVILILLNTSLIFASASGDPLFLNSLKPGPLYLFLLAFFLLFIGMSLANLIRSARAALFSIPRKQLILLAGATLIVGLTGLVAFIDVAFDLSLPRVILSILPGIAVVLVGYGVARYSALMEGRTIRRDFVYNAVAMGLITTLYLIVTWFSGWFFNVPAAAFVFVVLLAIVTHSAIDIARRRLDVLFYHQENRQLRASLRRLASLVGEQGLKETLSLALDSMCAAVRATYGLVLLFEDERLEQIAKYRWHGGDAPLSHNDLTADDVLHLEPGHLPPPLAEAALLIPLYVNTDQIGASILGRPVNGIAYSQADVDLLLYPSDQLADAIQKERLEAEYLAKLSQLTRDQEPKPSARYEKIPVQMVEEALRNLYDYAYLGDIPLGDLKLVRSRLPAGAVTHLDLGKAVHSVLSEALEKLRPEAGRPGDPAPREWHPFLILHGAYFEDKLNRDIMSQLYISEGTFNRTRRTAIRSVTRALGEMEAALH